MCRSVIFSFLCFSSTVGVAAQPEPFQPASASVQRYGPAWRYPQAGWIVLHIEGKPYDRGYQHGRLLATEIASYIRCYATQQSSTNPSEGWRAVRTLSNSLFLRKFDKEYLEEMQGIADGASDAGAKVDGRTIDLVDIVTLNVWAEVMTLDSALDAAPTGLEGIRFPKQRPKAMPIPGGEHCSAFAATGPATADGKIVFGHITMFGLYPGLFYNVWLDIKPEKGHRIVMQTYPGGIQSGMDYYINDAGIMVAETTIDQTKFNPEGVPVTNRIRKALQYSDSIDKVVEILRDKNNGLYANEWLIGDAKTNEIAMLELGTHKSRLRRSSKNEWVHGTEGFYWGCNNTKDLEVRLETIASVEGRPANMVWQPSDRDRSWLKFYTKYKGKINANTGREALMTPPLAAHSSLDAKVTTTALAKELKSLAIYGPPLGKTWLPSDDEKKNYPEIRPLVANPWTLLEPLVPPPAPKGVNLVDLSDRASSRMTLEDRLPNEGPPNTVPAWHGTILPKTDDDVWLAGAFAEYEKIVAVENAFRAENENGDLTANQRHYLALMLSSHRAEAQKSWNYQRTDADHVLSRTTWVQGEIGKGVMRLCLLRMTVGAKKFEALMDDFGKKFAGKSVTAADFIAHAGDGPWATAWSSAKTVPNPIMTSWMPGVGANQKFPVKVTHKSKEAKEATAFPYRHLAITSECGHEEHTHEVVMNEAGDAEIPAVADRKRLVVGKYEPALWWYAETTNVMSFYQNLESCVIVYGTRDFEEAQREAAERLQNMIRTRWSNITVPIYSDADLKPADLINKHAIFIGGPASNGQAHRLHLMSTVQTARGSFVVNGETYAHPGSALVIAGNNPFDGKSPFTMLVGLSAEAIYQAPAFLMHRDLKPGQFLVIPGNGRARSLVLPPKSLTFEPWRILKQ